MTYQIENRYFHHALIEISRAVLDDLDSHYLLGLEVLAFDYLSECTLAQNVQNQISVPRYCEQRKVI
jgi:hypothetical protein